MFDSNCNKNNNNQHSSSTLSNTVFKFKKLRDVLNNRIVEHNTMELHVVAKQENDPDIFLAYRTNQNTTSRRRDAAK